MNTYDKIYGDGASKVSLSAKAAGPGAVATELYWRKKRKEAEEATRAAREKAYGNNPWPR